MSRRLISTSSSLFKCEANPKVVEDACKIDGVCIKWILNYRNAKNSGTDVLTVADSDGHSGVSWQWTKSQSVYIDNHGWEQWLMDKERSSGYETFLKKHI